MAMVMKGLSLLEKDLDSNLQTLFTHKEEYSLLIPTNISVNSVSLGQCGDYFLNITYPNYLVDNLKPY